MSKITLTPNASGTGTFTVASPNSNTNRTITLPDADVTLGAATPSIDDNGNATAITIDSNENVGIGTSSPASLLNLQNVGGGSGGYLRVDDAVYGGDVRFGMADGINNDAIAGVWGNNNFLFYTNSTERMRISSSGQLLLGTTSGTVYYNSTSTYNLSAAIKTDNASEVAELGIINGNNNFGSTVDFLRTNSAGNDVRIANFGGYADSNTAGSEAGHLRFNIKGSSDSNIVEAMRIDSSGNLLVGTTTNPNAAKIAVGPTGSNGISIESNSTSVVMSQLLFRNPNGIVGSVTTSASATSYNTSSDYRLKTDAQPMTGASARVQALNPVNFEWIADGTRVDGFLAHEAQEVVPEAVTGTKDAMRDEEYEVTPAVYEDVIIPAVLDEDGNELEAERTEQQLVTEAVMGTRSVPDYQGIDQSKLVPLLTAALQEALTEISDLKARVTALEAV